MVVTITTKSHTYLFDDPEEMTIEAQEGITFEASKTDEAQLYVFKTEEEK